MIAEANTPTDIYPDLARLFEAHGSAREIAGGSELSCKGDPADELVLLVSGRLAEIDPDGETGGHLLAIHRPGAVIGANAVLTGAPHACTLTALRDSEIVTLPKREIDLLVRSQPALFSDLVRFGLMHDRRSAQPAPKRASILGFVAVCDSVAVRDLVEPLAAEIRRLGLKVAVLGAESLNLRPADLSELESRHDYLLMAAGRADVEFTNYCGRQIDRLILVGGAHSMLPAGPFTFAAAAIRKHRLMDLVLIQPADLERPRDSTRWLKAAPTARLFQVRAGRRADFARLARSLTGRSIGLALSGGGARAYAHIGALKALKALDIPVDFVTGTSMGAIVGAGWACGWSLEELDERIREAFVASSPLADIAFPILAMTRGREVERRLEDHFGDVDISDLWLPFVCVSTNLTAGRHRYHRDGRLRDALRASISLPGLLPPVVLDGQVLVDGAMVQNLPVGILRDLHEGPSIGVDVARTAGLEPEALRLRPSAWQWLASGAWRRGPPIVSVLIRSATVQTTLAAASGRGQAAVLIEPKLEGVELRDWKAYDAAVASGFEATMASSGEIRQVIADAAGPGAEVAGAVAASSPNVAI